MNYDKIIASKHFQLHSNDKVFLYSMFGLFLISTRGFCEICLFSQRFGLAKELHDIVPKDFK